MSDRLSSISEADVETVCCYEKYMRIIAAADKSAAHFVIIHVKHISFLEYSISYVKHIVTMEMKLCRPI